jgi:hypothetical protein
MFPTGKVVMIVESAAQSPKEGPEMLVEVVDIKKLAFICVCCIFIFVIVWWTCINNSSSSALEEAEVQCILLMKQQFVITLRYTILQEREKT